MRFDKVLYNKKMSGEDYKKSLETELGLAIEHLRGELQNIRGNRPSIEMLENLKITYYDQPVTLKEVGSFSLVPPREVQINVWDKTAVPQVVKAIEDSKMGLTVQNESNVVRGFLSSLSAERKAELMKIIKKSVEEIRIEVRAKRDAAIKKMRAAEDAGELTEDDVFKAKEAVQKSVDAANQKIEALLEEKEKELEG